MADKMDMSWLYTEGYSPSSKADSCELEVKFKKTVNIRQYETEVMELSTKVKFDRPTTEAERAWSYAVLEAQLEMQSYDMLSVKGAVTTDEYNERAGAVREYLAKLGNDLQKLGNKS